MTLHINQQFRMILKKSLKSATAAIYVISVFIACTPRSVVNNYDFIDDKNHKTAKKDNQHQTEYFYYEPRDLVYNDHIYYSSIKTVKMYKTGEELKPPFILLHSGEQITCSFDDFETSVKNLYYSVEHCNADWTPSGLMESEYLSGFFSYNLTTYKNSFNTYQNYIHYSVTLPNEQMQFTRSGNYLLKIYNNNNPNELLITRRFVVYEDACAINPEFLRASDVEERTRKQEIDFTLRVLGLSVPNPFTDIKVCILQNYRWDNMKTGFKPTFVKENEWVYNLDEPHVFFGGNEYRFFDLKSLRYNAPNIGRIDRDTVPWNVHLLMDEKRSYKKYLTYSDINGQFVIRTDNSYDPEVDADYVNVHFTVPSTEVILDGSLYVFGAFTDWQLRDENKLHYDYTQRAYKAKLYLKQGIYNYSYALARDNKKEADETFIEGTHFDTENNYTFLVYFRDLRCVCDRVIGFKQFNSRSF